MAAEDLVPNVEIGELLFPAGATKMVMLCDENNVRKGRFVTITDGENYPPKCHEADAGEPIGGVALEAGSSGSYILVLLHGVTKMYAGAACVALDVLKSDAEGRAVPIAATNVKMEGAVALMKCGEADDEFIVFVSVLAQQQVLA
jgi:hypothetical protein